MLQNRLQYLSLWLIAITFTTVWTQGLFQVNYIEFNNSILIATSNHNYALTSPKLLVKDWKTVSVNGDKLLIVTTTGAKLPFNKLDFSPTDMQLIESIRDEISTSDGGYRQSSAATGGSSDIMISSSSSSPGNQATSSMTAVSSTSSTGRVASATSTNGAGASRSELSLNMKDDNNYSVSRSDFPFNWARVFVNNDLVTVVQRDGEVRMYTMQALDQEQSEFMSKLKLEVTEMKRSQAKQLSNTMQQSVDMVSNIFNNIMGQFPKPPDYQSAVGNMFGNNFPFGPNNSPFSQSAGWPFAGGSGGAGAFAFASRR